MTGGSGGVARRPGRAALVAGVALSLGLAGIAAAWSAGPGSAGARAEIAVHYSSFRPAVVTATAGEPITVVLRNDDPIDHEWLVGDDAFHARHRTGYRGPSRGHPDRSLDPGRSDRDDDRHVPAPRGVPVHLPPARPRGLRHGRRVARGRGRHLRWGVPRCRRDTRKSALRPRGPTPTARRVSGRYTTSVTRPSRVRHRPGRRAAATATPRSMTLGRITWENVGDRSSDVTH